ncbi:putative uncharacterized protein [Helicobacter pylori]|nr:putative uncharacterized protein [Helicobacter pylori]
MAVRFGVIFITDNYTIDSVRAKYLNTKYLNNTKDTFGNLLQLLTNLKNKEIEFDFHKKINYGLPFGIIFITSNSDNPI